MIKSDYSEYLKQPGMLDYIEQEWLKDGSFHDAYAAIINRNILDYEIKTVIEVGCGTGNVAARLLPCKYLGIDSNKDCITIAKDKALGMPFICADIRKLNRKPVDLVFCFGVLKHFGLHEWDVIFAKIASLGQYFIFDIPIADELKDDGEDHHHVWQTIDAIKDVCKKAGLEILNFSNTNKDEVYFITKRIV
jgi:SAM-dependent methyltransferase